MQLPTGAAGTSNTSGAAGTTAGAAGSEQSGTAGTGTSGAAGAGDQSGSAGTVASTGGAGTSAAGANGAAGAGAGGSTGGAAGATTGAAGTGSSGQPTGMSSGCGMTPPALATMTSTQYCPNKSCDGTWSVMASTETPGLKAEPTGGPAPMMVTGPDGKTWPRGFWMKLPPNYDKTKPSRVIYEGAGCDDYGPSAGGTASYQYLNIAALKSDAQQTILVGISYDPARTDYCYDDQNPKSNDFAFFPLLHKFIESNFCVDLNHQFFSGYSSGSWLANQFTCAFPDVLRGVVEATGEEAPMMPTCVQGHPVAGMFLHEIDDPYNPYAGALPGCERLLKQNGCSTTTCVPSDTSLSTPYTPPKFTAGANPPPTMNCVNFKGCPASAPVVFCTTNGLVQGNNKDPGHYIGAGSWIPELFTDFIVKF